MSALKWNQVLETLVVAQESGACRLLTSVLGKVEVLGGQGCPQSIQLLLNTSHHGLWPISEHEGLLVLDITQMKSAFFLLKSAKKNSLSISSSVLIFLTKNSLRQQLTLFKSEHIWDLKPFIWNIWGGGERCVKVVYQLTWKLFRVTVHVSGVV